MRRPGTLALAMAGALIAASCGSGPTQPSNPPPGGGGGGGGGSTTVTITITGQGGKLAFSPNPATVAPGQLVVFKNNDVGRASRDPRRWLDADGRTSRPAPRARRWRWARAARRPTTVPFIRAWWAASTAPKSSRRPTAISEVLLRRRLEGVSHRRSADLQVCPGAAPGRPEGLRCAQLENARRDIACWRLPTSAGSARSRRSRSGRAHRTHGAASQSARYTLNCSFSFGSSFVIATIRSRRRGRTSSFA